MDLISVIGWDEVNTQKNLITRKKYFKSGDSLRVFEYLDIKDSFRFKVISRINNILKEYPKLDEILAIKICENIVEKIKDKNFG